MAKPDSPPRRKPRFRERNAARQAQAAPQPDTGYASSAPAPSAGLARPAPPGPPSAPSARPRTEARSRYASLPAITRERALYGLLLAAGFTLRIWDVGSRAMHGDESVHAWLSWNLYTGVGYQYDPVYHGPLQFIVTAFFFFLFGASNITARLMAVLFGTTLICLPYFLRHWMGRAAALGAATYIAFSPAFVYVSRLERDDIITSFFAFVMAIAILSFVRTRQRRYVYLGAAAAALSLSAMENSYITFFVFGTFLLIVLATELASHRPLGATLRRFWERTGEEGSIRDTILLGAAAVLLTASALTVVTGLYLPVPFVLGIGVVLLVHRQTLLSLETSSSRIHPASPIHGGGRVHPESPTYGGEPSHRGGRVTSDVVAPGGKDSIERQGGLPYLDSLRSITAQEWLNALTIVVAILFLAFSTFGTNLRGIWDTAQPFFNTGHACPGNPYFLNPCRKDIVGGLFYWLSQHSVHRGGQPWFYYSFLFGLYEQIALILGVGGILWFLRRPTLFTSFLTYWAILMFGIYSWAGEKFPWLMIHPLLPFVLLAAMFVVDLLRLVSPIKYVLLAILALLALLELHSMYEVNFVNGADPVEMMVYVQSSPDTPKIAADILSISNKVTNGNTMNVTVDSLDTWPFAWYLRGMPNVGYPGSGQIAQKPYSTNPVIIVDETDQPALYPKVRNSYTGHRYRLRWWFPEDYKSLTWSSFAHDLVDPGYWRVVTQWLIQRRPFGPKDAVWFYYYVKNGLVSPY